MKRRKFVLIILILIIFAYIIYHYYFIKGFNEKAFKESVNTVTKNEAEKHKKPIEIQENNVYQENSQFKANLKNKKALQSQKKSNVYPLTRLTKEDSLLYHGALNDFSNDDFLSAKQKLLKFLKHNDRNSFLENSFKYLYYSEFHTDNDFETLIKMLKKFTHSSYQPSTINAACFHIDQSYLVLDDYKSAIINFEKCLELDLNPIDSLQAIIDLGQAYTLQYRFNTKQMYFGKFKEFIPSSIEDFDIRKRIIEDQIKDIILSDN